MASNDSLLDRLPGGRIVAKDLSIARSALQGNAYCRFDCDTKERKYCSKALWEDSDDQYVIPEDGSVPRELKECDCCGHDSYQTEDDECGTCGKPMFECPADGCSEEVHGKPDNCPSCGASYGWN